MFTNRDIGNRITVARERTGLTQEEVAEELQKSRKTIVNWENGKTPPRVDDLKQLSDILNCDFGYFIGEIEEWTHQITDIKAATGLSSDAIAVLLAIKEHSSKDKTASFDLEVISSLLEDLGDIYLVPSLKNEKEAFNVLLSLSEICSIDVKNMSGIEFQYMQRDETMDFGITPEEYYELRLSLFLQHIRLFAESMRKKYYSE